jgi:hypothetical protein
MTGTVYFLMFLFPVTLPLVGVWVWAFTTQAVRHEDPSRLFVRGCLPSLAIPAAILLCGAAFAYDPTRSGMTHAYPQVIIWVLLLAHVPLGVLHTLAWREGEQSAVSASWVLAGFVAICTAFVSTMSVTGTWL